MSLKKGLGQEVGDWDEQPHMKQSSRRSPESAESASELSLLVLETGKVPEDE